MDSDTTSTPSIQDLKVDLVLSVSNGFDSKDDSQLHQLVGPARMSPNERASTAIHFADCPKIVAITPVAQFMEDATEHVTSDQDQPQPPTVTTNPSSWQHHSQKLIQQA